MKNIFIITILVILATIHIQAVPSVPTDHSESTQVAMIPKNSTKLKNIPTEAKILLNELTRYVKEDISHPLNIRSYNDNTLQNKIYTPSYLKIDADTNSKQIIYQNQWYLNTISAYDAWRVATGKNIIIAVIDTGIDYNSDVLAKQLWINTAEDINNNGQLDKYDFNGIDDDGNGYIDDVIGYDFVDWNIMSTGDIRTPDPDPMDEHGHGTQVASLIAGKKTDKFSGIAYNAKIMALRTHSLHGTSECKDIVNAIIYAVLNGANIINLSSGEDKDSPILHTAIKFATAMNVIVVCSAGNEGSTKSHYPSDYEEVICVGGCNSKLERMFNFGDRITITAPGGSIYVADINNTFKYSNGTSFSAPIVSAIVAIILEKKYLSITPTKTGNTLTNNIKSILQTTALQISNGWTPEFGAGIVNAKNAINDTTLSDISIQEPSNNAYFYINDFEIPDIEVVGSTISPLISNWIIRISDEPTSYNSKEKTRHWDTLFKGDKQLKEKTLAFIKPNIKTDSSKTYIMSLLVNLKNGNTMEHRIKITFIKEKPQITELNIYQPFYYQKRTSLFHIKTTQPSYVKIYYKEQGESENYKTIISNEYLATQHVFTIDKLPVDKNIEGYAIAYVPLGHTDIFLNETKIYTLESEKKYFTFERKSDYFDYYTFEKKEYSIPSSYIYDKTYYRINSHKESTLPKILASLLDKNYNIEKLSTFEFQYTDDTQQPNKMKQTDSTTNNLYAQAIGDINNDGQNEIIAGSYGRCWIYEGNDSSIFSKILYSTDENVTRFCEGIADLNNDGKQEIIYSNNYDTIYICDTENKVIAKSNINALMKDIDANKFNIRTGIAIGDFYGDGKKYIALTPAEVNYLLIIELDIYNNINELKVKNYIKLENNYYSQARGRIAISSCDLDADNKNEIILMHYGKINYSDAALGKDELWTYKVFSINNDNLEKQFEDDIWGVRIDAMFANQSSTTFKNGISTGNVDGIEGDEIMLCAFPNLYILKWDDNKLVPLWNFPTSISNSVVMDDFDNNGKNEIGFTSFNETEFYEFNDAYQVGIEVAYFTAWAENSTTLYFEWKHSTVTSDIIDYELLLIETSELINPDANFSIYSTNENFIAVDNLKPNTKWTAFVRLKNYANYLSDPIEIWTNEQTKPLSVSSVTNKMLKVKFNERLSLNVEAGKFILSNNEKTYTPYSASSTIIDSAIILYFEEDIEVGNWNLFADVIYDCYNNHTQASSLNFSVSDAVINEIYLTSLEFIHPQTLLIEFSEPVENNSAININNYKLYPKENITNIELIDSNKCQITLDFKPKPQGKNYLIIASKNIKSLNNHYMTSGAGNTLGFVIANDKLNEVYIYPNPIRAVHNEAMISNLTSRAKVEIMTINGKSIKILNEYDGNGGILWDLRDNNGNRCDFGIYILHCINLDNNQEYWTKFAITK